MALALATFVVLFSTAVDLLVPDRHGFKIAFFNFSKILVIKVHAIELEGSHNLTRLGQIPRISAILGQIVGTCHNRNLTHFSPRNRRFGAL
jgi:hypothetical protein